VSLTDASRRPHHPPLPQVSDPGMDATITCRFENGRASVCFALLDQRSRLAQCVSQLLLRIGPLERYGEPAEPLHEDEDARRHRVRIDEPPQLHSIARRRQRVAPARVDALNTIHCARKAATTTSAPAEDRQRQNGAWRKRCDEECVKHRMSHMYVSGTCQARR